MFIVVEMSHGAGLGLPRVLFHLIAFQDSPYGMFKEDEVVFVFQVSTQSPIPKVRPLRLSNNEVLAIKRCLLRKMSLVVGDNHQGYHPWPFVPSDD